MQYPIFTIAPDWSRPVTDTYEHACAVITSYAGNEQRSTLRADPVRTITYQVDTVAEQETQLLHSFLLGNQSKVVALPIWFHVKQLNAAVLAGNKIITADTGYFSLNGFVLLHRSYTDYEAVQVLEIGAGFIRTTSTYQDWPAGTNILPLALARIEATTTRTTSAELSAGGLTFTLE